MKQLLILSGKGGTGKTTVASALVKLSKTRVFADCDVDAPNLHLVSETNSIAKESNYYGMPKANINRDICISCGKCVELCRFDSIIQEKDGLRVDQFACEGCGVCEYFCPVNAIEMKKVVAGKLKLYKDDDKIFSTAKLKMGNGTSGMLVSEVKAQMREAAPKDEELAIIDGSPGIGCPVIASISGVDTVLIVAEPSISGISDMKRIIETAYKFRTKVLVCVNKFDLNLEKYSEIKEYCKVNGIDFVGEIPYDKEAVKAVNNNKTIVDIECASGQAVEKIYRKTVKKILN